MSLGELNRKYWKQYEAGSTPGVNQMVPIDLLESLPAGAPTLDVGTGTGRVADYLADLGFKSYGIDINENEISENVKRKSDARYNTQDIAGRTNFPDAFFSLVIFRYTLTNIHKDQWEALSKEVDRITAPGGFVWLAEPHINRAYAERYSLGSLLLGDEHALYVFKDKSLAEKIKDKAALEDAIAKDEVARIVRHYSEAELTGLFPKFKKTTGKHAHDTSPSGYPLDTVVMTLQKTS